jgi:short-subunit dehydrogenase
MSEYLRGKSAVVTGASSGIGREIALAFSREGVNVLAVARREERLKEISDIATQHIGEIVSFPADLQQNESVEAITAAALSYFGTIDILVNNAAFGKNEAFVDLNESDLEGIIKTNLMAPARLSQKVLPIMIQKQSGHIVFVTSLAGKLGFPGLSAYSASKFGIEGLAESIRREVSRHNVVITVLRPGVTDTEFFENANMQEFEQQSRKAGKLHPPTNVAHELVVKMQSKPNEIVVGSDKWFLRIMPFVPEKYRLTVLGMFG